MKIFDSTITGDADMESFDKALWKSFLALNNAYAEVITNMGTLLFKAETIGSTPRIYPPGLLWQGIARRHFEKWDVTSTQNLFAKLNTPCFKMF